VTASARAGETWELWPEASAFVTLSPTARAYLDAAYAKGKESEFRVVDASAYLDLSIQPLLRRSLATEDWRRGRYLWARIGYTRVAKVASGTRETSEDRAVLSLYAKFPLPADLWIEGRARTDLRWIGGDYSTRYRARLEMTREFTLANHPVAPYLNAELFYDTRYGGWARALYQAGTEVTVNQRFRLELYLARQVDFLPRHSVLNALGLVAKLYF
jgi:hypothetical protein